MYILYSDGSASWRNQECGFAFILLYDNELQFSVSDYICPGTNNRAELMGVIEGLKRVPKDELVVVYSDSKYVVNPFNIGWIDLWVKNDWISERTGNPIKNSDLWKQLLELYETRFVTLKWVKSHKDDKLNNLCDERANYSRKNKIKRTYRDLKELD